MIYCDSVTITVGKKNILNKITAEFPKNSITVILGKNGSGKTTLLRAIEKELKFKGKIFVKGTDINEINRKELSRTQCFMPQTLPLPHITAEKLIGYGRFPFVRISGILSNEDKELVRKAIIQTHSEDICGYYVDELSGGERRRVFFSMILAQNTPIMLLDEPTSNLDLPTKKELLNIILKCKKLNKTVIVVLHDVNEAILIADKILVIDTGNIIFEGSVSDFEDRNIPQKIFGVEKFSLTDKNGAISFLYK